ncbi:hypothetical protein TUN199_00447 [Pyrenophora tritici-repentis]|nr:hypothetical protein TUN205_00248 [Pyrenophora tritici-repentis]KAI0627540.1 hypothetical protein TUN199_00447 [Pyrenophora tritici-repentis]
MPDWTSIPVNLTSDTIFFCAGLLCAAVSVWLLKCSWPWKKAEKAELIHDLERAKIELGDAALQQRLRGAEERLGRELVLTDNAKKGHEAEVEQLEKKISDLRKELDEAKDSTESAARLSSHIDSYGLAKTSRVPYQRPYQRSRRTFQPQLSYLSQLPLFTVSSPETANNLRNLLLLTYVVPRDRKKPEKPLPHKLCSFQL